MRKLFQVIRRVHEDESGHIEVGVPSLVAAIGAVVLGCGAAENSDEASIIGGVMLGAGLFIASVMRHRGIDYDVYRRIDALEKK
jgi:hypothetical protein